MPAVVPPHPRRLWQGLGRAGARGKLPKLAQFISAVLIQHTGRTHHPLSNSIINNFHRQSKGLGSILHPLPQGPAHALLYLPQNDLDLCCYFLQS